MRGTVTAIYPGSFDPVTNGHLDIIRRSAGLFDRLIVAVLVNMDKDPLLDLNRRLEILREVATPLEKCGSGLFSGPFGKLRSGEESQCDPSWHSRRHRLRLRVTDGVDESSDAAPELKRSS